MTKKRPSLAEGRSFLRGQLVSDGLEGGCGGLLAATAGADNVNCLEHLYLYYGSSVFHLCFTSL